MSAEWKPGDVLTNNTDGVWLVLTNGQICDRSGHRHQMDGLVGGRRCVVIDPEDREQVERLVRSYVVFDGAIPYDCPDHDAAVVGAMQAALRSLVEPQKPDEPTTTFAQVEDSRGRVWSRMPEGGWKCEDGDFGHYESVPAVKVIREGVTS